MVRRSLRRTETRFFGLVILGLFALSVLPPPLANSVQIRGPYTLMLTGVPPKIPADGQSYSSLVVSVLNSSSLPVIALQDIPVYLSSALPAVANVISEVTIRAGQSYALANVTTSTTPGTTTVTGSAPGLRTASVVVQTVIPSGFPDRLVAFTVPPVQLARTTTSQGEFVVQVQDDLGIPARSVAALNVSVSSSNRRVLNVSGLSILVPAQANVAWESYTTKLVTGSAVITASATGFASGSASVTVVQAPQLVLSVSSEPDLIAPGSTGRLVVSLRDSFGDPAEAPAAVQVYLTSSNQTVAVAPPGSSGPSPFVLTILAGQTYAETTFASKSIGNANFTASAHGLVAGFTKVTVKRSLPATNLRLYLAPNPVSTGQYPQAIAVGIAHLNIRNQTLNPSVALAVTPVVVTASDNATGKVVWQQYIQFKVGESYEVVGFSSTQLPSAAIVTAAAQNLVSAQASMTTLRPDLPIGPPPTKVVVSSITPSLPADGNAYQGLLVSLKDGSGGPAVAPNNIPVRLSLSRTDVAQLMASNNSVTLPAGQGYVIAWVRTQVVAGTVNVTAESAGFNPSWTLLSTKALTPAKLALYASPSPAMLSAAGTQAMLAVQLQDADGNPARARAPTPVSLVSSNTTLFGHPLFVTLPVHSDFAFVPLSTGDPSSSVLTAISPGLRAANATFTSYRLPVGVSISSSASTIYPNGTAVFTASLTVLHEPLLNASVSWHVTGGSLSAAQSVTSPAGTATATFHPSGVGVASVYATLSSNLIGSVNSTTSTLLVVSYPAKAVPPPPSLTAKLVGYLPYIGVAAAAAVLVVFFVRRRRRGEVVEDEGFDLGAGPGEDAAFDLRGAR